MDLNEKQEALIAAWNEVLEEKRRLTEEESSLRLRIHEEIFKGRLLPGTEKVSLPAGWQLKLECKNNYKFDNLESLEMAQGKFEETPEGFAAFQRLVRWKPELSIGEYKKLLPEQKRIIDEVLTSTPAKPVIELIEPKVK
jgi:hypothetical protein